MVGEKIKEARLNLGLTQKQVADKLGIPSNEYSKIERNKTTLTIGRFKQISGILKMTPENLLYISIASHFSLSAQTYEDLLQYFSNLQKEFDKAKKLSESITKDFQIIADNNKKIIELLFKHSQD